MATSNPIVTGTLVTAFNGGRDIAAPGSATTGGGANIKKPMPVLASGQGSQLNRGRLNRNPPNQVHHNGVTKLPTQISNTRP